MHPQIQQVIDELHDAASATIDSWEFNEFLIEQGQQLKEMPKELQTSKHKVAGCISTVYLHAQLKQGKVHLYAWADAQIVKGLVGVLVRMFDGLSPRDIISCPDSVLEAIAGKASLTPGRINGLHAAFTQLQAIALGFEQN